MGHRIIGLMLIAWCVATSNAQAVGLEVAIGMWQESIDGTIGYQEFGNPDLIDLDSDLNFGDESNIYARAKIDLPAFLPNIYLVVVPAEFEGTGTKSVQFTFGDATFNANAQLQSKITIDQYDIGLYWGLPFVTTATAGMFNVDLGLNVRLLELDVRLSGRSAGLTGVDRRDISVPVPMLYLAAQVMPTENFKIEAEARGISIGDNKMYSIVGRLNYSFAGPLFVAGGYRYDAIDVDEGGIVADIEFSGPFLELGLTF